jgi:hypothetical protein
MARQRLFPGTEGQLTGGPRRTAAQRVPAQMCLRLARHGERTARRSPSRAPINASHMVLLSNDRPPLPAIRKPQYARAMVQRIMRRLLIGPHLSIGKTLAHSFVRVEVCEMDYGIACVNNHNDLISVAI